MKNFHKVPITSRKSILIVALTIVLAVCACVPSVQTNPATETIATATTLPTGTATLTPPKVLNICIADEPVSLYRYDGRNPIVKQSLFAALYDDPFEHNSEEVTLPALLERIPSVENGAVELNPVLVAPGDVVVDAYGNIKVFKKGSFVRPAGCLESACAVTWDGSGEFSMDQQRIAFPFNKGLRWSDGNSLTAQDSVFSYTIASDSKLPSEVWALKRTDDYLISADNSAAIWKGIPGFVTSKVADFFWSPVPEHLFKGAPLAEIGDADMAKTKPTGWGPYRIIGWDAGKVIHLEKNPFYFRLNDNLPYFDLLDFWIIPNLEEALQKLETGDCDVLDPSYGLENLDKTLFGQLEMTGNLQFQDQEWMEQLVFGVVPSSYDDGYNVWVGDRPDYFGDKRTRQALIACIDPSGMAGSVMSELFPETANLSAYPFAVDEVDAGSFLDEVGWKDMDADPATPRTAIGIPGIQNQTPFEITLFTSQSGLHQALASRIVDKLSACGIGVTWQALPRTDLYAPGPEGVLFGRRFDLALVSWQPGKEDFCRLYSQNSVPSFDNGWIGTNLTGLKDEVYDLECADLALKLGQVEASQKSSFTEEFLSAVPLFFQVKIWLSRPDLQIPETNEFDMLETFLPLTN